MQASKQKVYRVSVTPWGILLSTLCLALGAQLPDIRSVPVELNVPPVTLDPPAPGRRVRQQLARWRGTDVHHLLYLPADWKPGRRYPLLVEYSGNGPYRNDFGDISEGTVEGSVFGYGISGGNGFVWLNLPFVDPQNGRNQTQWWGDVKQTAAYAQEAIAETCARYGANPEEVVLTGFSRGAIACNYIGLADDRTAAMWLAFIPYSHYDGVRRWPYDDSDGPSAVRRMQRLAGRASFIIHENSVEPTREWILSTGIQAPFTFRTLGFRNHNDTWVLRDVPERRELRAWLAEVLRTRPGTQDLTGRIVDKHGRPLRGAALRYGPLRTAVTGKDGRYRFRSVAGPALKVERVR